MNMTSSSDATSSVTVTTGPQYDAWMYPDAPGALGALRNGNFYSVKAEFMTVNDDGTLRQINQDADHPNGYSPSVVQLMNDHSRRQYITISGDMDKTALAMQNPDTIPTIADFASKIGFGVELDWEGYGQWTPEYYQQYKTFLGHLASALHDKGHTLIVDGPPIYDSASQSWYQWKYEEISPLVNGVVMMIYDNQYDTGVGNSIAPRDWSASCLQWLRDKAGDNGIPGIAAYGYKGAESTGRITVNTSDFISDLLGSLLATRTADGDLTSTIGDTFYDYSDQQTVNMRARQAQAQGFNRISVWSLGGNPWPTE
ncbi:MAG: hypothetical protein ACQR33_04695 [Candidatus Saccharibacteria bacterium]